MDRNWITIVSGLPRSGTSMMMRMVEAGGVPLLTDRLRGADEDNPHGYFELEAVKATKQDASWVEGAVGRAVKVVHLLLPELPADREYRVVMMNRDLDEVVASQATMLARSGRRSAPPEVLKRVFAAQMQQVRSWMGSRRGVSALEVSYKRVLEAPLEEARRVAAFLAITGDPAVMAAAVDRALYRNRTGAADPPRER
jgi:sulfotransferase family protein